MTSFADYIKDREKPLEFQPIRKDEQLFECPVCGAAIRQGMCVTHATWHHDEQARNFTGF